MPKDSKKYVTKLLINVNLQFFIFLIYTKLKKYVTKLFLKILFSTRYVTDQYKTQQMCDEDVYDCLAALKFVPD